MDEIAAMAKVSKQTVYKHFTDKQRLLSDIVFNMRVGPGLFRARWKRRSKASSTSKQGCPTWRGATPWRCSIRMSAAPAPRGVRSDAVPDLAQTYYERAPKVGLEAVETGLGLLGRARPPRSMEDFGTAANQFAYLILGPLIDNALI